MDEEEYIEEEYTEEDSQDMLPDEKSLTRVKPSFDQEDFTFDNPETKSVDKSEDVHRVNTPLVSHFVGGDERTTHQPMSSGINDNIIDILGRSSLEEMVFSFELVLDTPKIQLLSALFDNLNVDKDIVLDKVIQNLMNSNDTIKLVRDKIKEKLLTLI